MPAVYPALFSPRRFAQSALALVLLLQPVLALAQEEKKPENVPLRETIRAFWAAQSEIARWLIGLSSFAVTAWLSGGCVLGYLIFSVRKQDALSSARWGYCFGALLWTVTALFFMWIVMQMREPLWYVVIDLSVAAFFGVLFGFFFRIGFFFRTWCLAKMEKGKTLFV